MLIIRQALTSIACFKSTLLTLIRRRRDPMQHKGVELSPGVIFRLV